jgi:septum site-determining protein MinC
MNQHIQIKGIREGLLITLGDQPWDEVHQALLDHLDQQAEFLRGARLALDVGNHVLKAADLGHLSKEIADRDLTLWAVISNSPATERSAQSFGLATRLFKPRPEPEISVRHETAVQEAGSAILVRRTLRSGASLRHPGHIILIGDINPGAEIVARGDVIVWGRLRGMVHAGAEGDEGAVICALDLSPTQLRIASQIAVTPKRRGKTQPEMARIVDGQVVAEPWVPKREKI